MQHRILLLFLFIPWVTLSGSWFGSSNKVDFESNLSPEKKALLEKAFKGRLIVNKSASIFSVYNLLCKDLTYLKNDPEGKKYAASASNLYVFHGLPGCGKTATAKALAEITGPEFKEVISGTLVTPYQGEGPKRITDIIEGEIEAAKKINKRVVIFFDEIDAIASTRKDRENRVDDENSTNTLWKLCDKYHKDPHVVFIFATNKYASLAQAFRSRVNANAIEFKNPNKDIREEVIRLYATKSDVDFSNALIKKIVTTTDGNSIRFIENFIHKVNKLQLDEEVKFSEEQVLSILDQLKEIDAIKETDDREFFVKHGPMIMGTSAILTGACSAATLTLAIYGWYTGSAIRTDIPPLKTDN